MKTYLNTVAPGIILLISLFWIGCSQPCPEPPEAEVVEAEDIESLAPDFTYEGWFFSGDSINRDIENIESVIVFTPKYPIDGSFLQYGTRRGHHNLCNEFEDDGTNSKVILRVGRYDSRNRLKFLASSPDIDLSANQNNPTCIEWYIDEDLKLWFRIGTVDKAVDMNAQYALPFDDDGSIKLTGEFPVGIGSSVPALIGADDARGNYYDQRKVISYSDGVGKSYASLFYVSSSTTEGILYNNLVGNTNTHSTNSNKVGVKDWSCQN